MNKKDWETAIRSLSYWIESIDGDTRVVVETAIQAGNTAISKSVREHHWQLIKMHGINDINFPEEYKNRHARLKYKLTKELQSICTDFTVIGDVVYTNGVPSLAKLSVQAKVKQNQEGERIATEITKICEKFGIYEGNVKIQRLDDPIIRIPSQFESRGGTFWRS